MQHRPHSLLGVASFGCAILVFAGTALLIYYLMFHGPVSGHPGLPPLDTLVHWWPYVAGAFVLTGLLLGLAGIAQSSRDTFFAVVGIVLCGLFMGLVGVLMLGMSADH